MRDDSRDEGRNGWMDGGRRIARSAMIAAVLALVVASARPAHAETFASDFGVGVGAVFVDLVYMPVKVVYATLGGLTGGFAFVLTGGRMDTATAIWRPSLGGTYVITPSMLRGEEPIYFSGSADDEGARDGDDLRRDEERPPVEEPLGDRDRSGGPY
jgi:hypothetical protein